MGTTDRVIRIVLGVVLVALGLSHTVAGGLAIAAYVVGSRGPCDWRRSPLSGVVNFWKCDEPLEPSKTSKLFLREFEGGVGNDHRKN